MSELQFTVPAEQSGKRIDSWLAEQIEGLTRSAAQNLLSEQAVSCNGQPLTQFGVDLSTMQVFMASMT